MDKMHIHQVLAIVKHLAEGSYPSNLSVNSKEALFELLASQERIYRENQIYKSRLAELEEYCHRLERVSNDAREALNILNAIKDFVQR